MQQGFTLHKGTAVPLDQANIDTDQIIPKQFLTSVSRSGFGKHLFHDWRYLDLHEQEPNPDFVLNKTEYQQASILLSRENFGCGSSREHAPWALTDFGFRAVIATSFADIFYDNCLNNQLLPVQLTPAQIDLLFDTIKSSPKTEITVDLPQQHILFGTEKYSFEIDSQHKENLLKGLDSIGQTLKFETNINQFESSMSSWQN